MALLPGTMGRTHAIDHPFRDPAAHDDTPRPDHLRQLRPPANPLASRIRLVVTDKDGTLLRSSLQPVTGRGLSQLGARLGVGGILNELTGLFPLRIPEQLGHPLLGDDGGGLHAGDRCIELVDDRRHASLEMPTSHRNESLTAGGVQRPDEEIGGTTRTGEDPRTDP